MDDEAVIEQLTEKQTELIEFLYVDYNGLTRGKVIPLASLKAKLADGIGLTKATLNVSERDTILPVADMTPIGELRLIGNAASAHVLPYMPQVATLMGDIYNLDKTPYASDPRTILKRVVKQLADAGFTVKMAYENEFELFTGDKDHREPAMPRVAFSTESMDFAYPFILKTINQLQQVGIMPNAYYPEGGIGQHELSMLPQDPVTAADNEVIYKRIIKNTATDFDLYASFAPKPLVDSAGSGAHIHLSLWRGQEDAFFDADAPMQLSKTGQYFVGGVLKHIQGLLALTCPSANSYQRLAPGHWSSAYATYGKDNREAAVRIPSTAWGDPASSMNIELKASDATANPYLAFAGLLAAGLDGIQHQTQPGDYCDVDPATLSEAQRNEMGIHRLPQSLNQAVDAFVTDSLFHDVFGPQLIDAYAKIKREDDQYYSKLALEKIAALHRELY
ncbi:glutamine synthetase family protein [Lacticaseibacillus parahuelsenbergensis]|uniref:Glutamine synthetase family protein n=1 Tax=Lacticaseibacillus parahuelsenbergensis TaxID=3068305 RepID=A0ABY9L469_9LACO|nr:MULTISPECIES: glutamine synthetase family protein [Lacticaseibacillus]MDE3281582.1 glutamine synthetase family protein [Lacticaseibacillus casei]WLV78494.1 glutamine synthetase family protein [Lacticaseibacillus sp. NCIMB 15471]